MNLRTRLRLLMLVLLLPCLAYILTASVLEHQRARTEAQAQLASLARLAASDAQQTIQNIQAQLALAAALETVQAAARNGPSPSCDAQLQASAAPVPAGRSLAVWNTSGRLVCGGAAGAQPLSAVPEAWFRRAVESQAFAIGDFQLSASDGVSTITFGYPLIDSRRQVLGVV